MVKRIGIVVAMEEELYPILNHFKIFKERSSQTLFMNTDCSIVILQSGVGKVNASIATSYLINKFNVDIVVNVGTCAARGGLLSVNDLVTIDQVYDGDFDISVFDHPKYYVPMVGDYINTDQELLSEYKVDVLPSVPCFSVSIFKEDSMDTHIEDYIIDMEYYGVAATCRYNDVPCLGIKVVSDTTTKDNHVEHEQNLNLGMQRLSKFLGLII